MPDTQNLGVAAVVALLILREVFGYLKTQKRGNGNGEKALVEAAIAPVYPILAKQTEILSELRTIAQRQNDRDLKADFVLETIADGIERVRSNQHDLRDSLNIVIAQRKAHGA